MDKIKSPLRRIREKCLDCSHGSSDEAKKCPVKKCPLWEYRLGKNPHRTKREYSPEERAKLAERLAACRKSKKSA